MISSILNRALLPLLLPVGLLLIGWHLLSYQNLLPESLSGLIDYAPYWFLIILLILGISYNRGKVVLSAMLLVPALFLANYGFHQQPVSMEQASLIELSLLGILPFNLALISTFRERGLINIHSISRCGIVATQAAIVLVIFFYPDQLSNLVSGSARMQFMNYPFLAPVYDLSPTLALIPIPHAIQLLLGLGSVLIIFSAYYYNSHLSFGLLAIYFGYSLGVLLPGVENLLSINLSMASLLLCVALLRDSYNMAYRDELTGLPQRRALNEQLNSLGKDYTLAMLDVDHFKKFNDTHGHDIGDQVLQMVASQIAKVGGGGKAYRYGGEEFSVIFSSKDLTDAIYYLDEVRTNIQDYEMVIRDDERPEDPGKKKRLLREKGSYRKASKKVSVTISIGVASREHRDESPGRCVKEVRPGSLQSKKSRP